MSEEPIKRKRGRPKLPPKAEFPKRRPGRPTKPKVKKGEEEEEYVEPPLVRLASVQKFRVKNLWAEFVLKTQTKEPTPEEVHEFCCIVSKINAKVLEPCGRCFRRLSSRERCVACKFCGFRGNAKIYYSELHSHRMMQAAADRHAQKDFKARDPKDYDR